MVQVCDNMGESNHHLHGYAAVNISCGIRQLWCFSSSHEANPEKELVNCFTVIARGNTPGVKVPNRHACAFYVFSDKYDYAIWKANEKGEHVLVRQDTAHHGKKMADYILQEGLGEITETPEAINPNTG